MKKSRGSSLSSQHLSYAYADPAGNLWSADFGFSGPSSAWNSGATIGNTGTQPLYQAQRYTTSTVPLVYTFFVSKGYSLTLKWTCATMRLSCYRTERRVNPYRF